MPGASLVDPGITTWTDNVDNWRAADADYLQKRSVIRFATVAARSDLVTGLGVTPVAGYITYVQALDALEYSDSSSAAANVWRRLLAPKNLGISDTSASSFGMRLASDGSASLAFEAGKVVLGPTRIVTVDTSLKLKTGVATASLTTDATSLVSDVPFKAPSVALTGALTSLSIANSGALTTASLNASGNVQAASLNVSGTSTLGVVNTGALSTTGTIVASAQVSSAASVLAPTVIGGQLWMTSNYIQNVGGGSAYMRLTGIAEVYGAPVVLNSAGGPARFGTSAGPYIACVVSSAGDPGVGNYPEGTIWAAV